MRIDMYLSSNVSFSFVANICVIWRWPAGPKVFVCKPARKRDVKSAIAVAFLCCYIIKF